MILEDLLSSLMDEYGEEEFSTAHARAKKARRTGPALGGRPKKQSDFDLLMCWFRVEVVRHRFNKNVSEACSLLAHRPKLPVKDNAGARDWLAAPENHNIDLNARAETLRHLYKRGRCVVESLPESTILTIKKFVEMEANRLPHFLVKN